MKIRLGFVTNSSSSSFIISHNSFGGKISTDIILRTIQMALSEIEEATLELSKEAELYGYENFIDNYILSYNDDVYTLDIIDDCLDKYGISIDELIECYKFIHNNHWILEAEGYADYERLRKENCESGYDYKDGWPFVIYDHTSTENDATKEVLEFYNEVCRDQVSKASDLGQIGVYSRDCWLPSYIVDTLRDISAYGCGHMG